ncbi:MAG TPA: PQQ-binding-like beta-propeller repeat protein [Solirubrobacteraceae bacterium]|nr:PQQ-binding-like beta-propeller repeat protein [Solirubrobacteraceae bacterium]
MSASRSVCAALVACALLLAACGRSSPADPVAPTAGATAVPVSIPSGDWTRFNYDAARSGVGPADTGIIAGDLGSLRRRVVRLDGTVDSSPIEVHAIRIGGHTRDVVVVTTTYGRTIALDAGTGARLWEYVAPSAPSLGGSAQITTATPIVDPDRRYVYAASPDGRIRKLVLATGREVRSAHWPVTITFDATHEKIPAALNIRGRYVIATTGGYNGDAPPYQGHVVAIDRVSGRILHVFNSLCSDRPRLIVPSSCRFTDSAIFGRSGAVVEPGTGRLLVATGNGPFNGSTAWGDSVLELSPDATRLLHNWTPTDQASLNASDTDIGSTSPALLPAAGGRRLAVQGGKDGVLKLLDLDQLNGTSSGAGKRLGGELQRIAAPGSTQVFADPAVWRSGSTTYAFVADAAGTAAYVFGGGAHPRLSVRWQHGTPGTSPVLAGGLLYVFDQIDGRLLIRQPASGRALASLPASTGHWNSPIVVGGRIILPVGNANDHATSGELDIYHLPGR